MEVKIDTKGLKVGRRDIYNLVWTGRRSQLEAIRRGEDVTSGMFFFDVRGKSKTLEDMPMIAQLRNGFEVEVTLDDEATLDYDETSVGVWPSDRRRWGRSVAEQVVSIFYQVDRSLIDKLKALLSETVIADRLAERVN